MSPAPEPLPIRDAATIILVRRGGPVPQVLMGQRGNAAAFMPDKFVFPGGAVDAADFALSGDVPAPAETRARLVVDARPELADALPRAAVRELWEETGLMLGRPDPAAAGRAVPPAWRGFFDEGLVPNGAALRFVFRAITPPGRPRRFDARFFLAEAGDLQGRDDDFGKAGDELRHLQWLDLAAARALPLPFITEVVLGEIEALLGPGGGDRPVPFFHQTATGPRFKAL
ncbi:MAG: NUDIX hydrolase [Amaricoccus sp.]|uniref:NUDIX hydrolase n=1 Tax=Amaricoccus sp. TaxID=1872485 RepID=UPI0039E5687A